MFFAGKECLLTFIQEARERIISKQLERHLAENKDLSIPLLNDIQISFSEIDRVKQQGKPSISEKVDKKTYYIVVLSMFTTQALLAIYIDDLTLV